MSIEWLAGLFEGEGYISGPTKLPHQWMLGITSTDYDVLEKVVSIGGGKIYGPYKTGIPNRKPQFTWYLSKKSDSVPLLEKLLPHMCSRRAERAAIALAAHQNYEKNKPRGPGSRGPRKKGQPQCLNQQTS